VTASRRAARVRDQKLVAIRENSPLTSAPIVEIAVKAAIETKKAIIAYSIAVAPPSSGHIRQSFVRIAGRPATRGEDDGKPSIDDW
jgi:hypothetical protein